MKRKYTFRNSSIRTKLTLLMAVNVSVALLASAGILGLEIIQNRATTVHELRSLAGIVGDSATAALSFSDHQAASDTLSAFRGDPRMVQAVIYDKDDKVFASYRRIDAGATVTPPLPGFPGARFERDAVFFSGPIAFQDEHIGSIYLRADLNEEQARVRRFSAIVSVLVLAALGLSLLFSSRVQRAIAGPIGKLAAVARLVSVEKDYSVRATKVADDEIGILIDSFNEMLLQIESRDGARKAVEDALRESEERYALAAHGANDGLWDWKLTSNSIYFSARWTRMLGYSDDEMWSDPEEWFARIHPVDRDRVRREIEAHCEGKTPVFTSEYRICTRSHNYIWVLCRGIAVRDATGKAIRVAGSQTDITEGKVGDPLTELPNRLYFVDKLESAIEREKSSGQSFAVLFLDLDRFKLVNDSLGHAAGDQLLMEIAGRLRAGVRFVDTVGRVPCQSTIARLGGDEFAVLIENTRSSCDAIAVAERILKQVAAPVWLAGRQMFAGVSIGIAMSSSAANPEELLRNADTAMYRAKAKGKGRFEVFDEGMRKLAVTRMEIESDLRRAVNEGEFLLHYQPQISLSDRRISGFEALVRWNHPQRGLVPPSEFIPIAEETNLIVPIGRWVLREACRQMVAWQKKLSFDKSLTISVNLSYKQLAEPDLAEEVGRILTETGLDPSRLRLELTESAIMENAQMTIATLKRLKEMNIGLEIDDFGTGYSSLSYLRQLPFDTLKIDRSFVKEMGIGNEGSEIVGTILRLADSLGMNVVAEGIEDGEQMARLANLGCDYGQGFYFSKPLDATAAQELISMRQDLLAMELIPVGA